MARICLLLEDYACVLDQKLIEAPDLESRGIRTPRILRAGMFDDGVRVMQAYRHLGETEAAEKLPARRCSP